MTKVGIIGECMVELFDTGGGLYKRTFGGDTLNTSVYLNRATGDDVEVHYVTVLSDDPLSEEMLSGWRSEGLHVDTIEQIANSVPGLYMIQTDESGERSFLYWRDQAPAKKLFQTNNTQAQIDTILSFDWLYFSGISLAVLEATGRERLFELLASFKAKGGKIAYDGNYRPRLWHIDDARHWMEKAYRICDVALPSVDDEFMLWDDNSSESVLQRLEQFGCSEIVLKRGVESCLLSLDGQRSELHTTAVDNVVDTTAAGDSFSAGYLSVRQRGGDVEEAVRMGQKISGQVIQQKGAIVSIEL